MFDEVGEVKYGTTLAGNAMAKLRLYVACYPADDPTSDPIPVIGPEAEEQKIPPDLALAAEATLDRLNSTEGGMPELLRALNINLEVAGELWLVGWAERGAGESYGPAGERWEIRSVSEVTFAGGADQRTAKVAGLGETPREVLKGRDEMIRVWVRHPRYGDLPDSNLRGVLADCRALLALQQQAIAEARSRMSAGALTVPNELTISRPTEASPEDPDSDPFLVMLETAMIDAVEDLSSPSSVAPFVIRGPAEYLQPQYLRRIELGRVTEGVEAKIESRVQRLARGMNLPVEVLLGHQQTTFANAAQVDQDTFEDHYEPRARLLVDTLSTAYLRPTLIEDGHDPAEVARIFVWYDASLLLGSPDTDSNADAAFDNQAISWSSYRRAKGFDDADAPSEREQLIRAGLMRGILTADLTTQLLNLLVDPEAEGFPPLVGPPPAGGGGPPPDEEEAASIVLALLDRGLLEVAPDGTLRGRRPLALEASAREVTEPPGRTLLDIDRDCRSRLQAAFDAALERALERAGNRLRAKANGARATLRRVAPRECASVLGPSLVAATGTADEDLLAGAWDQLEGEFRRIGGSAQKRALGFAGKIVGGMEPEVRRTYGLRQAFDLDEAWDWTKENLDALAKTRLYEPDPLDPDLGEFDPTSKTPTGLIRQAMRRAGGVRGSENFTQISTGGTGSAWITVPDGSAPGGIATGELITQIVRDEGGSVSGYRWVYGPADRTRPFLPHLHLDGLVFASFTDPRLVSAGSFPPTSHFIPGDHRGCICDVEPIVLTPDQVAALKRDGYLPDVPDLPNAPTPVAEPEPPPPPVEPRLQGRDPRVAALLKKLPESRARFIARNRLKNSEDGLDYAKKLLRDADADVARRRAVLDEAIRDGKRGDELAPFERMLRESNERRAWTVDQVEKFERSIRDDVEALRKIDEDWAAREDLIEAQYLRQREDMPRGMSGVEANRWMTERWGTNWQGEERAFHFAQLGDELGERMARATHDLLQRFDVTGESLLRVGRASDVDVTLKHVMKKIGDRTYADASDHVMTRSIRLNPKYISDAAKDYGQDALSRNTRDGWFPPTGDTFEAIYVHEFGHHVHFTAKRIGEMKGISEAEFNRLSERIVTARLKQLGLSGRDARNELIKREVSQYALKNYFELHAESFQYAESAGENASPLAKELHRLIVEWAEGDGADRYLLEKAEKEAAKAARAAKRAAKAGS